MHVGSYLELFTTLFGWQFYDRLWDILTGTGLAFLPFLGIVLNNVKLETQDYYYSGYYSSYYTEADGKPEDVPGGTTETR